MKRTLYTQEHQDFRAVIRDFIDKEVKPHHEQWEKDNLVDRELFRKLGELGVMGFDIPAEYGGTGETSYRYQAVMTEECARVAVSFGHYSVSTGIVLPYLLRLANEEQKQRWLPGIASGEICLCIAMNTKFVLAECATEVEALQAMVDKGIELDDTGELTPADAAKIKLFGTETAARVIDKCLQLHGGYGYMLEYPIARLYADTRVTRIYGGTSEVMKTIIAKDLGL